PGERHGARGGGSTTPEPWIPLGASGGFKRCVARPAAALRLWGTGELSSSGECRFGPCHAVRQAGSTGGGERPTHHLRRIRGPVYGEHRGPRRGRDHQSSRRWVGGLRGGFRD